MIPFCFSFRNIRVILIFKPEGLDVWEISTRGCVDMPLEWVWSNWHYSIVDYLSMGLYIYIYIVISKKLCLMATGVFMMSVGIGLFKSYIYGIDGYPLYDVDRLEIVFGMRVNIMPNV